MINFASWFGFQFTRIILKYYLQINVNSMLQIINPPMLKKVSSPLVSLKVGYVMCSYVFGVKHVRIRLVNIKKYFNMSVTLS